MQKTTTDDLKLKFAMKIFIIIRSKEKKNPSLKGWTFHQACDCSVDQ